jgi:DMSO/TMAO reductase YedYZ heme-binding membrane subunit
MSPSTHDRRIDYIEFGVADLLVPFASSWRPAPVALGVVAFYLLVAVELTSLWMRRIPRRWWKAVHMTSFGLFWIATWHLLAAGSDATQPVLFVAMVLVSSTVVFLTAFRMLADRRSRRPSVRSTPTAVAEPSGSPRTGGVPPRPERAVARDRSHRTEVDAGRPHR